MRSIRPPVLLLLGLLTTSGLLISGPANACKFPPDNYSEREVRQFAREAFDRAAVVMDAEVITAMQSGAETSSATAEDMQAPVAYLRILRKWKGDVVGDEITVAYTTSCDIAILIPGQRFRVLLASNGVYQADQGMNGWQFDKNLMIFNDEIDELAGQGRPEGFAVAPGVEGGP